MVFPLELSFGNILNAVAILVAIYAATRANRTTLDGEAANKLREIETIYGERINLLQDKRRDADEQMRETQAKADFFKQHADRCEEMLRLLEGRVLHMEKANGADPGADPNHHRRT